MEAMNQPICRYSPKHIRQHDALHQKRRGDAKGNQVRQRIEFASERAFVPAHPRDAAVEQIKNAREQNEGEREFDGHPVDETVGVGHEVGLDNFRQRHEAAEQIARRQQVRQEINLQLVAFG